MIGADPCSDNCREESSAENRQLHFPVISVSLDTADHVVKGCCRR
ncbi:unnamed protein product, partial [Staurois parvus]